MSLVEDLADRLRATRDQLPVAEIAAAAERMRAASGLLAWVLHESAKPVALPGLGLAANNLDHAAAALRVAQDSLDDYCLSLGVQLEAYPDSRMPSVPSQVQRAESIDGQLTDWWSTRICQLSGFDDVERKGGAGSSGELLRRCVAASLDSDTRRLHKELVAAGPAVGLGLAAVAPPLLRHLASDLAGHPPRLEDLARVRRAALPLLSELLPNLRPDPAEEIIARVCHAQPQRHGNQPSHPADIAAACALLVAGLLRATGRNSENLSEVVEQERAAAGEASQRAADRARSHRAALRITDTARRRSAVDEVRPATP